MGPGPGPAPVTTVLTFGFSGEGRQSPLAGKNIRLCDLVDSEGDLPKIKI